MKKPPRKKAVAVTKLASASREDALFARVVDIIEAARGHVTRSVDTAMVQAYWLIGREIVEAERARRLPSLPMSVKGPGDGEG